MNTHNRVSSVGALVIAAVLVFATMGQYGVAVAQGEAQIFTDKLTYSPGDDVIISGMGFLANTTISLSINHPDYNIVNWDAYSDENGAFETTYRLDVFSETYTVTATDGLNSASTTFSDPSVNMIGADAGVSTHSTAATAEDYGSFTVPPTTSVSKTIKVKGNGYGGGGPGAVPFPVTCSASFDAAGSSAALAGKVSLNNSLCSITSNSPTGAGPVGVTVTTTSLLPGTYTGKLVGTATSGGTENYFFKLTIVAGDSSAPVITRIITGTLGNNGWYTSDVNIDWTVSDPESAVIIDSGCVDTTMTSDTAGITLTCNTHSAGGSSSDSVTIMRDATAPTISGSAAPAPNGAGWNNGNVDVTFVCSDLTSNIASCGPNVTLTTEGAGQSATGTAEDNAGNTATATVSGINIDKTAPSITATATPAANADGWNKDDVVVSFECADALSDVASCPADVNLTAETALAGTLVSGTTTDNAGNSMSASLTVKIDKTAPTISATAIPAPNANGWNNVDVTVEFGCGDALSGVAECPADVVLSLEGSGQSASGTATDNAGNTASITIENINIDKTKPTITGSRTPLANSFGWNNVDVTVHFECEDSLSEIDSCPADTVLNLEGADQFVTGTAYDNAGNSESETVSDINIDKTDPTISAMATPAANANGWNNGAVTVHFTCDDALSGVDVCPADVQLTTEGAGQSASGTVYDKAGNSESATATGINIDLTQPTVAITGISDGQSFYFGDPIPAAGCTADDALSGLDGSCSVGSPSPNNANVGSHTLTAQATDMAGNVGETTITYTIKAWTLKGFYQPTDKLPTINTVKNGATVPLKWQVFKDPAMTMEITDIPAIKSVASKEVACSSAPTDAIEEIITTGGTVLRYDATAHQFIDNWKTPSKPGKCFDVFMYTQDGSFLNARFQLK